MSPKSSPRAGSTADVQPYKSGASPVMRALDFRAPATAALGAEDSESDAKSQTAVDLRIIKSILASKKTSVSGNKPNKPLEVSHMPSGSTAASPGPAVAKAGSPVKVYTPDNYRTPTRKSITRKSLLSEQLLQNAELVASHDASLHTEYTLPTDKG